MSAVVQAMREYAQAIRGDWSDFDGRTMRDVLEDWASEIEGKRGPLTIEQHRAELGLCPDGNGHWGGKWGHCNLYDCPTFKAEQEATA